MRRRLLAACWRLARWPLCVLAVVVVLLLLPVVYVEVACRGDDAQQTPASLITDTASQRKEANTYLTYPEWHIVYAYDGMAQALRTGDEHTFGYLRSIAGFWRSACALTQVADAHGGADLPTRVTIHTIGVSFTLEMVLKAAYEETVGRATARLRGYGKTPQDKVVADMAVDYAAFLRQTPWYRYPFMPEVRELWAAPIDGIIRGWERRLGIGLEFTAKAGYARLIGSAAGAAPAKLVIRSVVSGLDQSSLSTIPEVTIVGPRGEGMEIETPRYDLFTRILVAIAGRGGTIREIAGNDDIMVTLTIPEGAETRVPRGRVILRMTRDGFPGDRLLVDVKVQDLAALLNAYPLGDPGLEHVFDY